MVGLNHEFARELLWREYPTDQRGSYFRQFWDVARRPRQRRPMPDALREQLRDIPPLHTLAAEPRTSATTTTARRQGGTASELVLVIRGELLKRYPTAVIYAHRASWHAKPTASIDPSTERALVALTAAEERRRRRRRSQTPLYEAKVDPDIYFFGFDLTAEDAQGGTGEDPTDDPGWFFVIKERPGEPRFGLDDVRTAPTPRRSTGTTCAGTRVGAAPGDVLRRDEPARRSPSTTPRRPTDGEQAQPRRRRQVAWRRARARPRWAYILFRAPVMVRSTRARCCGRDPEHGVRRARRAEGAPRRRQPPRDARRAERAASDVRARLAGAAPGRRAARASGAARARARRPGRKPWRGAARSRGRHAAAAALESSPPFSDPRQQRRRAGRRVAVRCSSRCASRRASRRASSRSCGCAIYPDDCRVDTFEETSRADRARERAALLARRSGARAASRRTSAPPGAASSAGARLGPGGLPRRARTGR